VVSRTQRDQRKKEPSVKRLRVRRSEITVDLNTSKDTVLSAPKAKPLAFDYVGTPWAHQLEALERSKDLRDFALLFDVGTGKSYTAILIARQKMVQHKKALRTFVVCPPIVVKNWQKEWKAHSHLKDEQILCLTGTGKQRLKLLAEKGDKAVVIITNYQSLTLMPELLTALKKWKPDIMIADEAHRCKTHNSKTCLKTAELSAHAKYRLILTGTPVLNTPMDLFGQYLVLDNGETFGQNFFSFRAEYFYDENHKMPSHIHFPKWKSRPGTEVKLAYKISSSSMSVKKSECLDLPPYIREVIGVELTPSQRKIYKEMAEDFVTYVDGKACVARLALTKMLRLLQITTGFVPVEGEDGEGRTICSFKDNPRIKVLRELLTDIEPGGKVIVWASFKQNYLDIAALCKSMELPYVEVHGDISQKDKEKAVKAFQEDQDIRVFIGNQGAGGIGINLIEAPSSVFYSRNFSLEQDLQAEARNYRGGSEIHARITRYDLVAENTIDEVVAERLAMKQAISNSIIGELARDVEKTL
jgi:SNF2 family DNA or RNA helicase